MCEYLLAGAGSAQLSAFVCVVSDFYDFAASGDLTCMSARVYVRPIHYAICRFGISVSSSVDCVFA